MHRRSARGAFALAIAVLPAPLLAQAAQLGVE
jgi:hypothetical protein